MYTISQNWKWARKNHLLAIFSLILLQYHLHASVICAQATSSVSVYVQIQVLVPYFPPSFGTGTYLGTLLGTYCIYGMEQG